MEELTPTTDDLSHTQRRALVDQARANMAARGIEQHARAYALWEQYVVGTTTRSQLLAILSQERKERLGKQESDSSWPTQTPWRPRLSSSKTRTYRALNPDVSRQRCAYILQMADPFLPDEAARRRAVAAIIRFTANTPLAPPRYERQLLGRYQAGELPIDAVLALLEASTYHVFYRSRATPNLALTDVEALVNWSREYNAQHALSGLLLYSDGRFLQVVEGEEKEVRSLFARIQHDTRHTQLVTLSEGPGPQRWFADWSMAWGQVHLVELEHVLGTIEKQQPLPGPITDPNLQTLLQAFHFTEPELG